MPSTVLINPKDGCGNSTYGNPYHRLFFHHRQTGSTDRLRPPKIRFPTDVLPSGRDDTSRHTETRSSARLSGHQCAGSRCTSGHC